MFKSLAVVVFSLASFSAVAAEPVKDTQRCDVVATYIRQTVDHSNFTRVDMYILVENVANKNGNLRKHYVDEATDFLNSTKLLFEEGYTGDEIGTLYKNACKGESVTAINR